VRILQKFLLQRVVLSREHIASGFIVIDKDVFMGIFQDFAGSFYMKRQSSPRKIE